MSGGGRHGFEKPYFPSGCHYRWYTTTEICMILERFESFVFIGDDSLRHIYAAFNMLLREDLATGGLAEADLKESERATCRCENQFMRKECTSHIVTDSESISNSDPSNSHGSPIICNSKSLSSLALKTPQSTTLTSPGTPHTFLPITTSPAPHLHAKLTTLLTTSPETYKPTPIILSLSLASHLSWPAATSSMDEWVSLADSSGRNVPFLWIGPNAAGHLKPPGQILSEGNNAIWHYTLEMGKEARSREVDALAMYNLTLQANSWDGSGYGMRVALVQAMMVSLLLQTHPERTT